ncbi:hypothetical protein PIB30_024346 [Stylosanthes scabra]|uniref:Uncharacterized protein n=1 Tax=Stylosanthes scabra TaxID=79078 RepID=A0ABU6Z6J4_9FABA|nr:hypothetical protein [Stylosanthes scabra]
MRQSNYCSIVQFEDGGIKESKLQYLGVHDAVSSLKGKPILNLCEELRCYIMKKMANHKRKLCRYNGKLAPVQQQKHHDIIMPASTGWDALWSGDNVFHATMSLLQFLCIEMVVTH